MDMRETAVQCPGLFLERVRPNPPRQAGETMHEDACEWLPGTGWGADVATHRDRGPRTVDTGLQALQRGTRARDPGRV